MNVSLTSTVLHDNCIVQFPHLSDSLEQDQEWCIVVQHGHEQRLRFHDYDKIYLIPGLYEYLFYTKLKCNSPEIICDLFRQELQKSDDPSKALKVLEIGAGNGMMGEQLKEMGAETIVGLDIIPEAKIALQRDRPDIYTEYFVDDLTQLKPETAEKLDLEIFNTLVVVAALGFGDIPPAAFSRAYNFVDSPGWVAFNIKDEFLSEQDPSGFCLLIREMQKEGILEIKTVHRFQHRLSLDGKPLYYNGVIAQKVRDIPKSLLNKVENTIS